MSKPNILIIGCGAVGLSQGYHLSDAANITFLVRPGRSSAFAPPRNLYDYKANTLRTFTDYRLIESTSEVAGEDFYCVFDTLDGHTARSTGGIATLKSVGDLIRNNQSTFVVYDAVGLDMDVHYASTMGIPRNRLLLVISMLVHQPTPTISIPQTADAELVKGAHILYSHAPGDVGLTVINEHAELTKRLEEVYHKGKLRVKRLPGFVGFALTLVIMHLVVWNIDGWREFPQFRRNAELWDLMLKAQKEMLRLPRYGCMGKGLSWVMGEGVTARIIEDPVKEALPMADHEFNAFHHGGKVASQDIKLLEDVLAEGEKAGRSMKALQEICRRAHEVQKAKGFANDGA